MDCERYPTSYLPLNSCHPPPLRRKPYPKKLQALRMAFADIQKEHGQGESLHLGQDQGVEYDVVRA